MTAAEATCMTSKAGSTKKVNATADSTAISQQSPEFSTESLEKSQPLSRPRSFPSNLNHQAFLGSKGTRADKLDSRFSYDLCDHVASGLHLNDDNAAQPNLTRAPIRCDKEAHLTGFQLRGAIETQNTSPSALPTTIGEAGSSPNMNLPESVPETSQITDVGQPADLDLMETNLSPSFPLDDVEFEDILADRIFEATQENSQDRHDFLPRSQLYRLINTASVSLELRRRLPDLSHDTIRAYANRICHGTAEAFARNSTEGQAESYQKIFAILALVNKVDGIELFLREGVCDADLPLKRYIKENGERRKFELRRKHQPGRRLDCFRSWSQVSVRIFEQYQWAMIPPFFSKGKRNNVNHYVLDTSAVLPFTFPRDVNHDHRGGYSRVFEADIHPDYHNFNSPEDKEQIPLETQNTFAIKRLDSASREAFQNEVRILKRFSGDVHPHLISLLATFERSDTFYLIFPWADADLMTYWKFENPVPTYDVDTVIWMVEQCKGLAEGLAKLHSHETGLNDAADSSESECMAPNASLNSGKGSGKPGPLYGRHGDIKPENILWFSRQKIPGHKGVLKISDFGLTELNSEYSRSQRRSQVPNSPTYRPPECDLRMKVIKQSYDIWGLGCLYLEFIAWMLGGWALVDEFARRRRSTEAGEEAPDCFFETREAEQTTNRETFVKIMEAFVKPAVIDFVSELHSHPRCSSFLHSFLDMVLSGMLVVESGQNRRFTCLQLVQYLTLWHQGCLEDAAFALCSAPSS